jgi:hypothetical protein
MSESASKIAFALGGAFVGLYAGVMLGSYMNKTLEVIEYPRNANSGCPGTTSNVAGWCSSLVLGVVLFNSF